ncbi:uncharacterized protein TM35_001831020 [Trypanosoma theileri]|uniref:COMM domain-containing protein n=1 Tax=Trypanosoma theileri TaxID=67003 RepID=A0A1X0NDF9_9TRYP|nr:uncharacterized protein TM35_001831020 [Trypanosoma theileri]ORC80082.1 hypothetical protein TM35_001831020 [Trypanosoma theileri]
MLPTTETWRQCAVMLSNASEQALHTAAATALAVLETGNTRVNELAVVASSNSDSDSGATVLLDTLLTSAMLFIFRQFCAEGVEDTQTARQFLLSHEVHIAPQAVDVIVEIWAVNRRRVVSLVRCRAVKDFCNSTSGNSSMLPKFIASRARVIAAKGDISTTTTTTVITANTSTAPTETMKLSDSACCVESLLLFPATSTHPDGVEVNVNCEEAYSFFCELDKINAKLDVLLGH